MLTTINKHKSEHARKLATTVGALVIQVSATVIIVALAAHNAALKAYLEVAVICLLVGCVGLPILTLLRGNRGESKPKRPHWKRFDETHRWDPKAEEWVPR